MYIDFATYIKTITANVYFDFRSNFVLVNCVHDGETITAYVDPTLADSLVHGGTVINLYNEYYHVYSCFLLNFHHQNVKLFSVITDKDAVDMFLKVAKNDETSTPGKYKK